MPRRSPEWWCSTDELKPDLARRAIRGGWAATLGQTARSLLELGSTLVLARLLLPEAFGLIGMVLAVTGFMGLFKDLGLTTATVQRERITPGQVSQLFWVNTAVSTGLAVLIALIAPLVASYYREQSLTDITRVAALSFLVSGLSVQHLALLRRRMLFVRLTMVELVASAAGVAAAVVLAAQGYGVWALVAKEPVRAVAQVLLVWGACDFRPSAPRRNQEVGSMLRFGGHLTGFSIVNYFARHLDDVLIGRYYGAHVLGLYQRAYELLMTPLVQVNNPIGAVAVPSLSRLADKPEQYRRAYLRILQKVLLVTMPLGALLITSSRDLIVLLFGEQWSAAAPIFFWMGFLTFTQPIGNSTGWLFISQDRSRDMFHWGLIGSGIAIVSFLVGLPWGATGVAASYSISGLLVRTPWLLWVVGRRGPVSGGAIVKTALPIAVAAVAALLATQALLHTLALEAAWLRVLVATLSCSATTLLALLPFPSGRAAVLDLKSLLTRSK